MFIGHYALGLAAKRLAPRTSLWTLIAAPTFADLIWPVFLMLGWERVSVAGGTNPFLTLSFDAYPISHSLVTLAAWGGLLGALYQMKTAYARGALVVGLLVFSHWVLDWIVHIPDLPLYPGGPKVGLGLWRSAPTTVVIESLMFIGGIGVYVTTTRARDRIGRYAFWGLTLLLSLSYIASLFNPPPANVTVLAVGGILFGWLFVALAWWADAHRDAALRDTASPDDAYRAERTG